MSRADREQGAAKPVLLRSIPHGGSRAFLRARLGDLRLVRPGSRYRLITDVVKALAGGRIVLEMFVDDLVLAAHSCLRENFVFGFALSRPLPLARRYPPSIVERTDTLISNNIGEIPARPAMTMPVPIAL